MKGVQNIYNDAYSVSSLLVFFVLILFRPALSISAANRLSSSESLTISSNRTLVSPGGAFELGFFKPSALPRWYLGIRYTKVSEKSYAWVANRDNPLSTSIGALEISGNNLVLLDQFNKTVWSTNLTSGDAPVTAEVLPNGNFVLRHSDNDDPSEFLWQSFDFPTDTLLPEMKLGIDHKKERNWFLTEWRAPDDPASGNFTFNLETQWGLPEFILRMNHGWVEARSGPWNGIEFSGDARIRLHGFQFYSFRMTNHSIYSILTTRDWMLERVTWTSTSSEWKRSEDYLFTGICDAYTACGGPNNNTEWAERDEWVGRSISGCVRRTQLSCGGDHDFFELNNTKMPDTKTATVDRGIIDGKKCKERCLSDCIWKRWTGLCDLDRRPR